MTIEATTFSATDLLEEADTQIAAGQLLRASDALWRAAEAAFQTAADARGWTIDRHRGHYDTYNNLRPELDIDILRDGMSAKSLMRQNLLDGLSLDEQWVILCRNDIRTLVNALQALI